MKARKGLARRLTVWAHCFTKRIALSGTTYRVGRCKLGEAKQKTPFSCVGVGYRFLVDIRASPRCAIGQGPMPPLMLQQKIKPPNATRGITYIFRF